MSELPPLRDFPLFASLDEATLQRLTLDAKIESYADGAVIFRQGDAVGAIMLIAHGFVKLLRTAPCGDETLVSIRSDRASLNDAPTATGEVFQVSAEAWTDLDTQAARGTLHPHVVRNARARRRRDRRREAEDRRFDLRNRIAESSERRQASCAIYPLALPARPEHCRFRLPYDKRLVAAQLGVTQETLSRSFARLREFGVRTETRDISVESVTRLCLQYDEWGRPSSAYASERRPPRRRTRNGLRRRVSDRPQRNL